MGEASCWLLDVVSCEWVIDGRSCMWLWRLNPVGRIERAGMKAQKREEGKIEREGKKRK